MKSASASVLFAVAAFILYVAYFVKGPSAKQQEEYRSSQITEATYDGCSYVLYPVHRGYSIAHKGNCPNH